VEDAESRIRPFVRRTYLEYSDVLSQATGAEVHLKCENLQHTGSFKVRGALNRILAMNEAERRRGVVAASTGNHGKAVAFALRQVGATGAVFVPHGSSAAKVEAMKRMGVTVRFEGSDSVASEQRARAFAEQHQMTYVSPYNDPLVVGGQGTIGLELIAQLDHLDAVFVSLGGGGLLAGVAGYLKSLRPSTEIIGCSPQNSKVMIESVRAGSILDLPSQPTLSDGTAGGVERDAITFDPCRRLVDDFVTIEEHVISETLRTFLSTHAMLIEGSAAVALAGCLAYGARLRDKHVAVILCGGNIGLETLSAVLGETSSKA